MNRPDFAAARLHASERRRPIGSRLHTEVSKYRYPLWLSSGGDPKRRPRLIKNIAVSAGTRAGQYELKKHAAMAFPLKEGNGAFKQSGNGSREFCMSVGTVKWFNAQKGFGFIQPDNGGSDAFVHITAVERAGLSTLSEGQKVSYELVADRRSGKMTADKLQILEDRS